MLHNHVQKINYKGDREFEIQEKMSFYNDHCTKNIIHNAHCFESQIRHIATPLILQKTFYCSLLQRVFILSAGTLTPYGERLEVHLGH